jgi:hypothetical protein
MLGAMVDCANSTCTTTERVEPLGQAPSRGYRTAQDARNLAAFTRTSQTAQTRAALERLERLLDGDAPPRQDAPRGYYFDGRF